MKIKSLLKTSAVMISFILAGLVLTPEKTEAAWTLDTIADTPNVDGWSYWGQNGFAIGNKGDNTARLYIYGVHSNSASSSAPSSYKLLRHKWNNDKGIFDDDGITTISNDTYNNTKNRFFFNDSINDWETGVYMFSHRATIGGSSHSGDIERNVSFSGFVSIGDGKNAKTAAIYYDTEYVESKMRIRNATAKSEAQSLTVSTTNGITFDVRGALVISDTGVDLKPYKGTDNLVAFSSGVYHVVGDNDKNKVGSSFHLESMSTGKDVWSTSAGTSEYTTNDTDYRYGKKGVNLPVDKLKTLPLGNYEFDYEMSVKSGSHGTPSLSRNRLDSPGTLPKEFTLPVADGGSHSFKLSVTGAGNLNMNVDDATAPTATQTQTPTAWTKGDVTLTVKDIKDTGGSKYKNTTRPDGTTSTSTSVSHKVSKNGTYTFKIADNSANVRNYTFTVDNIDKAAPTIKVTQSPTAWTNDDVTLSYTAVDSGDSGIKNVTKPDNTTPAGGKGTYKVSTNNSYKFTAQDNATNTASATIKVTNIDKALPSGTFTPNTAAWINADVSTTFKPSDTGGSGLEKWRYRLSTDNGTTYGAWSAYETGTSKAFKFTASGLHKVQVEVLDKAGNVETVTSGTYHVDKIKPSLVVKQNTDTWTNNDVIMTATGSDTGGSSVKQVQLPNGSIVTTVVNTVTATENGDYNYVITDVAGNSFTLKHTVSKIDRILPSGTFTPNTVAWINQDVSTTFKPSDTGGSGVAKWRYKLSTDNGATYGAWSAYETSTSKTIKFTTSGLHKVEVEVLDNAGNAKTITSGTYHVDKIIPSLVVQQDITPWTNKDIVMTATGSDTGGSNVKQIQLPDGSIVTTTVNKVTATQNETYTYVITDVAGNSYTIKHSVSNIDKSIPSGTFTPNTAPWINTNVTTTFKPSDTGGSNVAKWRYQLSTDNGATYGAWSVYETSSSKAITFSTTGYHKVKAEVVDTAGNVGTVTSGTYYIDKIIPNMTTTQNITEWTNKDVVITEEGTDTGGSGFKQIKLPDGKIVTTANNTYVAGLNGDYSFIITDVAGNTFTKIHSVTNIDKIEPSGLFKPNSNTTWSQKTATTFTPSDTGGSLVKQWRYRTSNDEGKTWGAWSSFIAKDTAKEITFTTSGKWHAQAEIYDNAGNVATVTSGLFNVDDTAPYAWSQTILTDRPTTQAVTIHLNLDDNLSGIKHTVLPNGANATGTNITYPVSTNGLYKFIIYDNANNKYEHYVLVSNIDKTPPMVMNATLIKNITSNTYDVHVRTVDDYEIQSVVTNTSKSLTKGNGSEVYSATGLTALPSSITVTNAAGGTTSVALLSLPTYSYSSNASVIRDDLDITFNGTKELGYELNNKEVGCAIKPCTITLNQNSDVSLIHSDATKTSIVNLRISNIDKTIYDLTLTGKRNTAGDSVTIDWSPVISNPTLKCTSLDGDLVKITNTKPYTFSASNIALDCVLTGGYNGQTLVSNELTLPPIYNKTVTEPNPVSEYSKAKFTKVFEDYQITGEFYLLNGTRNNSETQLVPIPDNLR